MTAHATLPAPAPMADDAPPVPAYEPVQFRGRYYLRGPLPAIQWLRVLRLLQMLQEAEAKGNFPAALADAAATIRRLLPPVSRWERWTAWCRPNPFQRASVTEIGVLLGLVLRGASVASRLGAQQPRGVPRG